MVLKVKNNNMKFTQSKTQSGTKKMLWLLILSAFITTSGFTQTGTWSSSVTGGDINYTITNSDNQELDATSKKITVVYLKNLGFDKIGGNTNEEDIAWLLAQGYRVIELDYENNEKAVSPTINDDIIAINDQINSGSFCGKSDNSSYRSYILFEGYRIARDVSYFKNDPTVYNWPSSNGPRDSLYMDIVYPANPSKEVPIVLSFSYSNSYYNNPHSRFFLGYTLALFDDSFLEGAPAAGIAWAIADHPKYCDWGQGQPAGTPNKTYGSYEVNPDAAQKVKSAIRTLRVAGDTLGLSGKIGIYGFSRGSDAGSMAIGDKSVAEFENAGKHIGVSDDVQVAALGSGVFDFTQIYNASDDGDGNLESRCPVAWGPLEDNYDLWESMGSAYLVETSATAPVIFFYNTDDAAYYQDQIAQLKSKLESLDVPVSTITDYGNGFGDPENNSHGVPKDSASLATMYDFFNEYMTDTTNTSAVITKNTHNLKILLSPNPAKDEIQLQFNIDKAGSLSIEVCNLSGKVFYQSERMYKNGGVKSETLNLETLSIPAGIYLLKISGVGKNGVNKFIRKG